MELIKLTQKIPQNFVLATFMGSIVEYLPSKSLEESFERLGGEYVPELSGGDGIVWKFPCYITATILEGVIKNTCFKCGGVMKEGTVLDNQEVRVPTGEFERGNYTPYKTGPAVIKHCRKCISCGHSHT